LDTAAVLAKFDSNAETGLPSAVIANRQAKYGRNQFDEQEAESILSKIIHNLKDVTTIILIIAALLSLLMGIFQGHGFVEFIVITGIIILNMALAISQERSAEKSLAALKDLNSPTTLVLRDSLVLEVDSTELVPGDVVQLQAGNLVSADARLLDSTDLAVDESSLTGESEPTEKSAQAVLEGKVAVADQTNMVFSGCLVTGGRAKAIVTATGMFTQMGHIAGYLNNAQRLTTPLQNRINNIGRVISSVAVIAALTLFLVGYLQGDDLWYMVFVAISLAVAAVPETLALIVTLSLAHGVTEMVKKNALIRKLPAVETLGSTSVICTDKTGTLTQNRMTIKRLWIEGADPFAAESDFTANQMAFIERYALSAHATDEAQPDGTVKVIGSPTEAAVIHLLLDKGGSKSALETKFPQVAEIAFSSERKMSTSIHQHPAGGFLVLTIGAFDHVPFAAPSPNVYPDLLPNDAIRKATNRRHRHHDAFANDSLRIFALGSKRVDTLPPEDRLGELEQDLDFEGIVGIIDPPRPEVAMAIAKARKAGIRTVMITGDHAVTAAAIGREIGLLALGDQAMTGLELSEMSDDDLIDNVTQYSVYARVSPEDKIRIVEAWQEHDEVVAMTGDGVNDAPALKAADVGVAMGVAGTEVAKSAADVILTDDNYSTIVEAVHKGRGVFSNIRKTVYFLLVCNFSEIVLMLGAQLFAWGMPLTPIMLLLINVLGDGIPGISLAREKSDPRIMRRTPIGRNESLFQGLHFVIIKQIIAFVAVGWVAFLLGANVVLSSTHPPSEKLGQTMCFLVVGWTSILHIYTVRSRRSIFRRTLLDNPRLSYSALSMIALFGLFVLIGPVGVHFGLTTLGLDHWLIVIGLSVIPTITAELGKFFMNRSETRLYASRLVHHADHE